MASVGLERGFDGGKLIKGRKRHLLVDTLGLMHGLLVHSAGVQDRAGGRLLLEQERVEFTPALEGRLLHTMAQMRALLRADADPGARWVAAKCRPCGYREACWGSFD